MKRDAGNALFLILIAVALFAALSYAVTSSGRGGGSVDKEQAEILGAQILNEVSKIQSRYQRLKLIGGYETVLLDDSVENNNGTCYTGGQTSSGCRSIGMLSSEGGLTFPLYTDNMRDPDFSAQTFVYSWQSRRVLVNSLDVGTIQPDVVLFIPFINPKICESINRRLNNSPTILDYTDFASTHGFTGINLDKDGTITGPTILAGPTFGLNIPTLGCSRAVPGSGSYGFFHVLEEN